MIRTILVKAKALLAIPNKPAIWPPLWLKPAPGGRTSLNPRFAPGQFML